MAIICTTAVRNTLSRSRVRPLARQRLGSGYTLTGIEYGARRSFGATTISLHPAGHILGSAQIRIEHQGNVWVVSGDYKRQADPTCAAFVPLECDVFVSEATFALPVYRWPQTCEVVAEIARWWSINRERGVSSILFCYALGKAQRVLAELLLLLKSRCMSTAPSVLWLISTAKPGSRWRQRFPPRRSSPEIIGVRSSSRRLARQARPGCGASVSMPPASAPVGCACAAIAAAVAMTAALCSRTMRIGRA